MAKTFYKRMVKNLIKLANKGGKNMKKQNENKTSYFWS